MSILDRDSLEQSPLADLHAIASELSIDGYRRLRKADVIDAILSRQSGQEATPSEGESADQPAADEPAGGEPAAEGFAAEAPSAGEREASGGDEPAGGEGSSSRRRRWRRGGRGRDEDSAEGSTAGDAGRASEAPGAVSEPPEGDAPPAERRPRREPASRAEPPKPDQDVVEGVVELLAGGSGFVRVAPPEPSDDDVYISSAQIKRCELVTGDRVSGPRRPPRRSERFASMLRIDTVNGRPAAELADSVRFEDRPVTFPDQKLALSGADPALAAIEQVAPIGRGSRVIISGPAAAGKTETLRRLALALSADQSLQLWLVLLGARPEELAEWERGAIAPAVSLSFAASEDAQSQALEGVVEQVRRLVARGGDAVILIDTLDGVSPALARKALASSRNLVDGGSLTVIATASGQVGGETTAIALERPGAQTQEFPVIDQGRSWVIRGELLG
jgi:transcription termination factor Rho